MSCIHVTHFAPCFINSFVPSAFLQVIFPGIANTFFPCSYVKSTVVIVPLFIFASITITPDDTPLIILFLAGKCIFSGLVPKGYSLTITPPVSIICFAKFIFLRGYI